MKRLRIAFLSYRSNPYSGGQGIYVKYVTKALVDLGHEVTVFSGPPYPDLDPRVKLEVCLLYTSPSPRDATLSRMPSSA